MLLYMKIIFLVVFVYLVSLLYKKYYIYTTEKRRNIDVNVKRKILLELFDNITNIANKYNIKLFMIYGTLLGYIRNKDLICYDFDLDFGVKYDEYQKMRTEIMKYYKDNKNYKISEIHYLSYKFIQVIHKKTGINADISAFYNNTTKAWRSSSYFLSKYLCNECQYHIPIGWIYPLKQTTFLNKIVYLPNDPAKLLKCYYGNNFMIPDHKCNDDCSICVKNT